jgi:pyruvate/2-oxoglutarate dehydrogenase complex dihydrolipoamide dehydrogenase (E3) component
MGYDTTIMVRSILLRGFDQKMADRIGTYMEKRGTKFYRQCTPTKFSKSENGKILVEYQNHSNNTISTEEFDTCLLAIGRSPDTYNLNTDSTGITIGKSGKIIVNEAEQTNVDNIFAIGDCADGRPELTPPAIMAGRLLSRRLFAHQFKIMDYLNIPTTVFTPIEYGACGYTEEEALKK